jgi:hypothetical protein
MFNFFHAYIENEGMLQKVISGDKLESKAPKAKALDSILGLGFILLLSHFFTHGIHV